MVIGAIVKSAKNMIVYFNYLVRYSIFETIINYGYKSSDFFNLIAHVICKNKLTSKNQAKEVKFNLNI